MDMAPEGPNKNPAHRKTVIALNTGFGVMFESVLSETGFEIFFAELIILYICTQTGAY
jgi:hypothetical protein